MPRYRLLETVNWEELNGQRVRVEVSASNLCLELKDGRLLKVGVAMRERPSRNGRAAPPVETPAEEGGA